MILIICMFKSLTLTSQIGGMEVLSMRKDKHFIDKICVITEYMFKENMYLI
jgi:hypothetical protein